MNQNDSADDPKQPPGSNAPGTSVDGLVGRAERLLRLAVDSTPNCVFIKDTEGRYRLVNPATGLVFGCSPASVLGRTDAELAASGVLTPETAQAFARNDRSVLEGRAPGAFIEPVRTPDGRIRWFETVKVPVASDGFKGILGVAVDVTELKEAEDALVRERDTARAYLDLAGTLIVAIRPDETVAMANRTACETLGWPQSQILGKNWFENFIPSSKREEVRGVFKRVIAGDLEAVGRYENPVLSRDGTTRLIAWHTTLLRDPDGSVQTTLSAGLDVTDMRQLEQRLRCSERRLRLVFENVRDVVCHLDQSLRVISVTPSVKELLGYLPEELIGRRLTEMDIVAPASLPAVLADAQAALEGDVRPLAVYELRARDGSPRYVEVCGEPVVERGQCAGIIAVIRDVTARDRALKALRESEARFRALVEKIPAITYTTALDPASTPLYVSPQVEEILGFTQADYARSRDVWRERLHPEDRERVLAEAAACHESGEPFACDYRMIARDGRVVWFRDEAVIVRDHEGNPSYLLGVMLDITSTRELEHQLTQARTLEAIGRLAAGIAHEINTPTQYIGDNVRFLRDAFSSLLRVFASCERILEAATAGGVAHDLLSELRQAVEEADLGYLREEIPAALSEALRGVDRIARIVLSVKEFSHPVRRKMAETDINRAIEATASVSRNEWKYVAEVVTDLDPNLPRVVTYPGELNQALLNLIVNAAQAIGEVTDGGRAGKGTITIKTSTEGGHAVIRIADTGPGIPPEVADKVFEPFFTTKEPGRGTGQGLAIAHDAIVGKIGGQISFETNPGGGTTFTIRLPLSAPGAGEVGE